MHCFDFSDSPGYSTGAPALDALERAYAIRDPALSRLKVDSRFEVLAKQPRFLALLRNMGPKS